MVQMVEERMTYILSIHASCSVKRYFKGKQRQHFIDKACHPFDTALTPGPDLRANVVHHRQPGTLRQTRQGEIKARSIDEDHYLCTTAGCCPQQLVCHAQARRHFGQDFYHPHHIQRLHIEQRFYTCSPHVVATQTVYLELRKTLMQGPYQSCSVLIA